MRELLAISETSAFLQFNLQFCILYINLYVVYRFENSYLFFNEKTFLKNEKKNGNDGLF